MMTDCSKHDWRVDTFHAGFSCYGCEISYWDWSRLEFDRLEQIEQRFNKLSDGLNQVLNVLGTGECKVPNCPGCHYEMEEAVHVARIALGLEQPAPTVVCPGCGRLCDRNENTSFYGWRCTCTEECTAHVSEPLPY